MRYLLYQLNWIALDWLFPPSCGGCNLPGVRWCSACREKVKWIKPPFCDKCGQKIPAGVICEQCLKRLPECEQIRSCAEFGGPLRNALHRLKYRKDIGLGDALAQSMLDLMLIQNWSVDLIAPVPLGKKRKKERGYNQAAFLAKPLAFKLDIPYSPKSLTRVRETHSQVDLNRKQRQKNVAGAFISNESMVSGKNILIVDDVTTSGSTLNACATALLQAGSNKVYGMTLARSSLSASSR